MWCLCDAYTACILFVSAARSLFFMRFNDAYSESACPYINHMAAVPQDTVFIETHEGIPDTGDACSRQENVIQASH